MIFPSATSPMFAMLIIKMYSLLLQFYELSYFFCNFIKFCNQKAHAHTALFNHDCFFTTFTQQIIRAIVYDVINVDIQMETN